jgi:DeoR/GlpR family transcriptional regulator of sugar metabolism
VGVRTNYKIAEFKEIDMVISNQPHPDDWKHLLVDNNVKWLVADKEQK